MDLTEGVLTFAVIVTLTGLGGLAIMYRMLRRSDREREFPKF